MYRDHIYLAIFMLFVLCSCDRKSKREYYSNGNLKTETIKKDSGKTLIKYFDSLGAPTEERTFYNGVLNGVYKLYDSGRVIKQILYKDNMKNGPSIQYYKSGQVKSVVYYVNNKREGKAMQYYENGRPKIEWFNKNDKEEGTHKVYYSDGKLELTAIEHLDSTVYVKEFDEEGKLTGEFRTVIVIPEHDTIRLGETYKASIEIAGPNADSSNLRITVTNPSIVVSYKRTTLLKEYKNKINFTFTPKIVGTYNYTIWYAFFNSKGDYLYPKIVYFTVTN